MRYRSIRLDISSYADDILLLSRILFLFSPLLVKAQISGGHDEEQDNLKLIGLSNYKQWDFELFLWFIYRCHIDDVDAIKAELLRVQSTKRYQEILPHIKTYLKQIYPNL